MQKNQKNKIIVFENREVRRVWHNRERYYAIVDVVAILTKSTKM